MHYPSTVDHFVDHDGSKYLSPLPFRCYSVHAFVFFNSFDIPSIKTKILSFQHAQPSSPFIDLHGLVMVLSWSCHGLVSHNGPVISCPCGPVAFAAPRKWRGPRSTIPPLNTLKRSHGRCSLSLTGQDPSRVDVFLSCAFCS
jgi:hypothetical protein